MFLVVLWEYCDLGFFSREAAAAESCGREPAASIRNDTVSREAATATSHWRLSCCRRFAAHELRFLRCLRAHARSYVLPPLRGLCRLGSLVDAYSQLRFGCLARHLLFLALACEVRVLIKPWKGILAITNQADWPFWEENRLGGNELVICGTSAQRRMNNPG